MQHYKNFQIASYVRGEYLAGSGLPLEPSLMLSFSCLSAYRK